MLKKTVISKVLCRLQFQFIHCFDNIVTFLEINIVIIFHLVKDKFECDFTEIYTKSMVTYASNNSFASKNEALILHTTIIKLSNQKFSRMYQQSTVFQNKCFGFIFFLKINVFIESSRFN